MNRTCEDCGLLYDDARQWTTCPHEPLMSDQDLARKDLACALTGQNLLFFHQEPDHKPYRIQSIGFNGMVTLVGLEGEYEPSWLVVMTPKWKAVGDKRVRHFSDMRIVGKIEAYEFEGERGRVFVRTDEGPGYWFQLGQLVLE